jgi:integrase
MARERYQRGSIERVGKRTKNWKGHWYEYVGDKRKHKSRVLGPCARMTKSEAQRKLDAIIAESVSPTTPEPAMTLERFADTVFLPAKEGRTNNTKAAYGTILRCYIAPHLGQMPVAAVRKSDVVQMANALKAEGRSRGTIKLTLAMLHTIYEEAVDNDLCERNPVRRIENPVPAARGPKPTLTMDQVMHLFASIDGRRRLLFRVLIFCGLRPGEALTLRWMDITERGLTVDESLDREGTKGTKTNRVRLAPLPIALRADLLAYRGTTFFARPDDFIFGSAKLGELIKTPLAHKVFLQPARELSGLGALLTFRICRRTLSTLLKEAQVSAVDIQAILGHSAVATTEKYYIQPVGATQERAINVLEAALWKQ